MLQISVIRVGVQGPAGPAPTIAVGTVTTGAPGSNVEVEITGTAPNYTLNVTIPAGLDGTNGTDANVTAANVTAANVATAIQAMSAEEVTAVLTKLGFVTYANLAAGNAALNIGDIFRDTSDSKFKTATA